MMDYKNVPIGSITGYARNPRDNSKSVDKVAASIREFGFLQPIVCDGSGVILAGHTRYAAAKKLGLTEVPVLYAEDLTPVQAKAYRLADNKVGEDSRWLEDLLSAELEEVAADGIDMGLMGFADPNEYSRRESWKTSAKLCDMKLNVMTREKSGYFYTSFFSTGKKGRPISQIKEDVNLVLPFANNLCDYIERSLGENLADGGWCICTTPRRRHKEGFHFATEICRKASIILGIPFRENVVAAKTRGRIEPEFDLAYDPPEKNIILYDDIITTGITVRETRRLLMEQGHNVLPVIAIRNQ